MQKAKEMGLTKQLQEHKEKLLPEKNVIYICTDVEYLGNKCCKRQAIPLHPQVKRRSWWTQNISKPSALLYTIPSMELPNSQRHMRKFIYLLP